MERLYFLDNLKTCIVVLMVVFHAAMSYMAYAPEWWYVLDGDSSLVGTVFVLWADIFIMPVMFFVAGYFALPSLARHGRIGFWRKKGVHIILPWLVGALVCAPYIAYLTIASRPSNGFPDVLYTVILGYFLSAGSLLVFRLSLCTLWGAVSGYLLVPFNIATQVRVSAHMEIAGTCPRRFCYFYDRRQCIYF